MSKLTLDEAIKHCEEVATEKEDNARWELTSTWQDECKRCAAEHRQFAEWLKELKSLRKKAEHLTEWNRKLIGYKNETICKWGESQEELQEAKQLLKAAVKQMSEVGEVCDCIHSQNCPLD
jgi:hypothetical protein